MVEKINRFTARRNFDISSQFEIGTPENSLKMKRSYVETVSVTSVKKKSCNIHETNNLINKQQNAKGTSQIQYEIK